MMDLYMTLTLVLVFMLFCMFAEWCGRVTGEQGRDE